MATKADRYEGIDGLKAYAIIGIALMHILSNGEYGIGGFVFERLIPSFTNLVFLFMMVSGFGMCCGYYQKIVDQRISVEDFYKKRYIKIWPYFALLCALDIVISPSKESLFEVFANLTLCQGLLPNMRIEVIGVSWTLAVIFVFYLLFPFFCFLIGNKKRAWGVAVAALVFNILCGTYFFDGNHIVDPHRLDLRQSPARHSLPCPTRAVQNQGFAADVPQRPPLLAQFHASLFLCKAFSCPP